VDILEPHEPFTVADFVQRADAAIADITSRGRRPIVVGGTGLYIKALTKGLIDSPGEDTALRQELQEVSQKEGGAELLSRLMSVDPATASRLHSNDIFRIIRALEVYYLTGQPLSAHHLDHRFAQKRYRCLKFAIAVAREELYRRINVRVEDMLQRGLKEEVSGLLAAGVDPELKPMKSIGYKEMVSHLAGMMTLTEAADTMARQTRHYGKRQMTWFRTDSEIKWVEYPKDFDTILKSVIDFFE
jgi:tRNA dimethylallyltransferase